jgi:hypothetical protein
MRWKYSIIDRNGVITMPPANMTCKEASSATGKLFDGCEHSMLSPKPSGSSIQRDRPRLSAARATPIMYTSPVEFEQSEY